MISEFEDIDSEGQSRQGLRGQFGVRDVNAQKVHLGEHGRYKL